MHKEKYWQHFQVFQGCKEEVQRWDTNNCCQIWFQDPLATTSNKLLRGILGGVNPGDFPNWVTLDAKLTSWIKSTDETIWIYSDVLKSSSYCFFFMTLGRDRLLGNVQLWCGTMICMISIWYPDTWRTNTAAPLKGAPDSVDWRSALGALGVFISLQNEDLGGNNNPSWTY